MLAGFIWGILHFPLGQVYYLSVVQVLIEYPIAYTFAGAAAHGFKCPKKLMQMEIRNKSEKT